MSDLNWAELLQPTHEFFGQLMRQMSEIPEGHMVGVDKFGNAVDRGPAPAWATETDIGPCLVEHHDMCVGSHPDHQRKECIACNCPCHQGVA